MNTAYSKDLNARAITSALWAFVLLNIVFHDSYDLFGPSGLLQLLSGVSADAPGASTQRLLANVVIELQLVMIVLCQVLPERVNAAANCAVAFVSMLFVLINLEHRLDDYFFAGVQSAGLVAVVWFAWVREKIHHLLIAFAPPVK